MQFGQNIFVSPFIMKVFLQTFELDLSGLLQLNWADFGLKMALVLSSVYRYVSEGHLLSLSRGRQLVGTRIPPCISGKVRNRTTVCYDSL